MESLWNSVTSISISQRRFDYLHEKRVGSENQVSFFISSKVFISPRSFLSHSLCVHSTERKSIITEAKKKKNDTHSFVSKPDETTGPFPEAVLLKKRTNIKEDGKVLPEFADAEEERLFEFLNLQLESELKTERVRHYEVIYLIHEDHVEQVANVVLKVEEFIKEKKGKIWRVNDWGLRRLAYKIKKAKNANYILMNFQLSAECINEFKSLLDKDERIIRHLVIKRDEAITEDCPPPPEFHTLRQEFEDDDDSDEDEDDGDADYDDQDDESGIVNYDDGEDDDNIIFVDDDEDDSGFKNTRAKKDAEIETGKRGFKGTKIPR